MTRETECETAETHAGGASKTVMLWGGGTLSDAAVPSRPAEAPAVGRVHVYSVYPRPPTDVVPLSTWMELQRWHSQQPSSSGENKAWTARGMSERAGASMALSPHCLHDSL